MSRSGMAVGEGVVAHGVVDCLGLEASRFEGCAADVVPGCGGGEADNQPSRAGVPAGRGQLKVSSGGQARGEQKVDLLWREQARESRDEVYPCRVLHLPCQLAHLPRALNDPQ